MQRGQSFLGSGLRKITRFYQAIRVAKPILLSKHAEMEEWTYPIEVDVVTAAEDLKKTGKLLDVREPMELEFCSIRGAITIPMGQVPHQLEALPRDCPLYILCHHGMRSGQVTAFLRQRGFENAINIAGGIDAWSTQVDSEIRRY